MGQNDQAQGYCEDALDIDPEYADAWTEVGRARYTRRNYEGSIEAFDKCIEYGSSSIECWYLRGLAHYYLGNCDRAWNILNEALPLAQQLAEPGPIVANIREGLRLTTLSCLGLRRRGAAHQHPAHAGAADTHRRLGAYEPAVSPNAIAAASAAASSPCAGCGFGCLRALVVYFGLQILQNREE